MNANNQNITPNRGTRLPEQDINCWIFSSMLEDILNAVDQDDPFSDAITVWAQAAWDSGTMDWILDNPTKCIHIIWPCWPTGYDNIRLHQSYDKWRNRYIDIKAELLATHQPKKAQTSRDRAETDPQKQSNSNANIALAQACKQKWQTIGQMRKP